MYPISLWFRTYSKIMKKLITELCRGCCICNVIKIALKMSEGHLGSYGDERMQIFHLYSLHIVNKNKLQNPSHMRVNLSDRRVGAVLGWWSSRWETLRRSAIRHILLLAEGDGKGGFVALAFPHHVHTRDTKKKNPNNQQTVSAAHRDLTKTSHQTLHPERNTSSNSYRDIG